MNSGVQRKEPEKESTSIFKRGLVRYQGEEDYIEGEHRRIQVTHKWNHSPQSNRLLTKPIRNIYRERGAWISILNVKHFYMALKTWTSKLMSNGSSTEDRRMDSMESCDASSLNESKLLPPMKTEHAVTQPLEFITSDIIGPDTKSQGDSRDSRKSSYQQQSKGPTVDISEIKSETTRKLLEDFDYGMTIRTHTRIHSLENTSETQYELEKPQTNPFAPKQLQRKSMEGRGVC